MKAAILLLIACGLSFTFAAKVKMSGKTLRDELHNAKVAGLGQC